MASEAIDRDYSYYDGALGDASVEFFHNVIHDMESVHWVLFFILKDVECKNEKAQDSRRLIDCELFIAAMSSSDARDNFVSKHGKILRAYGLLLGIDGREIYVTVGKLRAILRQYYHASEAKLPDGPLDITKFSGIHEEFITVWEDCKVLLAKHDIHLKVKIESSVPKRKAETGLHRSRESRRPRMCVYLFRLST